MIWIKEHAINKIPWADTGGGGDAPPPSMRAKNCTERKSGNLVSLSCTVIISNFHCGKLEISTVVRM